MTDQSAFSDELLLDLPQLIEECVSGTATDEQAARLDRLMIEDEQARKLYVRYVHTLCGLRTWSEYPLDEATAGDAGLLPDASFDDVLDEVRVISSIVPLEGTNGFLGGAIQSTARYFSHIGPLSYLIATFIMLAMGVVAWSWKLPGHTQIAGQSVPGPSSLVPSPSSQQFVGRITGMVDCRWSDPNTAVPGPVAVPLGRKYALASGLMEITYDSGAKVILQGPVTYEVESKDGGYLSVGKLTARVEKKEERRTKNEELSASRSSFLIPHSYFAVRTPTAMVTDLGTEFGVEVSKGRDTTSHVFRGSVRLQVVSADGKAEGNAQVLHENESARVEKREGRCAIVGSASVTLPDFVRKLVTSTTTTLDLVDVVAGGDGFSGRRGRGIDPTDGQVVNTPMKDATGKQSREIDVPSDGQYHRVDDLAYVDGVFIPDSRSGSVQLDSAGNAFADFGNASHTTAGNLWAGGDMLATPTEHIPLVRTKLGNIDYASPGHGFLFLHANKGITFDMQAMRQTNPGQKPVRFRAIVGNTETDSERGYDVCADVWVFVDGKVCFRRRQINSNHGAFAVAVPIGPQDRFLTLAATDGGGTIAGDWILFGDPRLELVPVQTTAGLVSEKAP